MLLHRRSLPRTFAALAAIVAPAVLHPASAVAQSPLTTGTAAAPATTDSLPLSLAEAVERALRTSDEARLAEAQVDVAEAQLTTARAGALPQLRLNGSYTHQIENARAQAVGQIFNQPNTYNVNANLSQTFFQGGRELAAMRGASRLRSASRLSAQESRTQVALDVQRAYVQALFAARVLEIQTQNLALAGERLAQVEKLAAGGRAARYDVLRARVERANIEPLALQAASDREIALLDLKRLLQLRLEQPVALTTAIDSAAVQAALAAADSLAGAPPAAPVGRERAAVRAAELTAQARRDAVSVARADRLPTVSAFFVTGYQAFPLSGFPTSLGDRVPVTCVPGASPGADGLCRAQNGGFFSDRQLGVQVSWPLFDGLRTKGNIELARAQARVADVQLNQERESVALEAARARAELGRARAAFEARRQNVGEADEAFRLATLRFNRGLGTQLELSDAQLALATARTDEARATYDLYLASASLARALGQPLPLPGGGTVPR
ncbi:MAG: TolC family protein [Gemmatimonadaceae bacterium]